MRSEHFEHEQPSMRKNPWFWIALTLKLIAAACFGSEFVRELFIPFVSHFIDSGFANPWDAFAAQGKLEAFPYSGVMLALLTLPQAIMNFVAPTWVHESMALKLFLIRLPMLAADLAIFAVLCRWFETKKDKVLWIYWFSPVLFYISYVHGQIDAIPSAFLFLSLYYLFRKNHLTAGLILGAGIAAKMHLLVALPFLLAYSWNNAPERARRTLELLGGVLAAFAALILPLLGSEGYRTMVLGTQETKRLFEIAIPIAGNLKLYLGPVAAAVILMRFASTRKISQDLLITFLALVFSALVLFVPPMPGWYFWSIPLVCYFFIRQASITANSYWVLNSFYLIYYTAFWNFDTGRVPAFVNPHLPESLAFTALQGSLAMVIFWTYRIGIKSNREYSIRNSPVLIGIGGDSGAGKSTLAQVLRDLLGGIQNSTQTNGDDYHRWARGDESWQKFTHLNPEANHMFLPVEHAQALKEGEPIRKPVYDHDTGKFREGMLLDPKPYVFFVGLHTFYLRRMRALLDVKIFVDPHESLRKKWKVDRDQKERGYTADQVLSQIESRASDSEVHIRPQRRFADWILNHSPQGNGYKTTHLLRNDIAIEPMVLALQAAGLEAKWGLDPDLERQSLEVSGQVTIDQVRQIAEGLYPSARRITQSRAPIWREGQDGIAQLIFLALLEDSRRNRSIEESELS